MHDLMKYAGIAGLAIGIYVLLQVQKLNIPTTSGAPVLAK